mgnify:CR=1 FL=1
MPILESTYKNKRIILADNASTDDSVQFVQQNFSEVEIIINDTNEGFAKGYNTAFIVAFKNGILISLDEALKTSSN